MSSSSNFIYINPEDCVEYSNSIFGGLIFSSLILQKHANKMAPLVRECNNSILISNAFFSVHVHVFLQFWG